MASSTLRLSPPGDRRDKLRCDHTDHLGHRGRIAVADAIESKFRDRGGEFCVTDFG